MSFYGDRDNEMTETKIKKSAIDLRCLRPRNIKYDIVEMCGRCGITRLYKVLKIQEPDGRAILFFDSHST